MMTWSLNVSFSKITKTKQSKTKKQTSKQKQKQTNKQTNKNKFARNLIKVKEPYSLTTKEWKVHYFSEWKMFHSKRVNFTLTRVKFHSNKSEFFTLFREWSLKPLFLEWTSLNFNKHKRSHSKKSGLSDHSLKRVKITLERVKWVRFHSC